MKWIRRALALIVALPVVAIAALLIAGQRPGAGECVASIQIDRPREEAFRHVEDPDRLRRWTGVGELEVLTPLPMQKGSRLRTVTVRRGQSSIVWSEITGFERDRTISLVALSAAEAPAPFSQTLVYQFDGEDGHCRLTLRVQTVLGRWWLRLFEPLITPAMQAEVERLLRALKAQVESESSPAGPGPGVSDGGVAHP
jgi:uncharacterized protein YndB with AHSA1/START domain